MIVKNLIFDLDGTLIDSSDGVVQAVNYSLRQMGEAEQPADVIKKYIGYPLSTMYPDFTDAPMRELYAHFQVKAAETVVSSTIVLPGVEEMVELAEFMAFDIEGFADSSKAARKGIRQAIKQAALNGSNPAQMSMLDFHNNSTL